MMTDTEGPILVNSDYVTMTNAADLLAPIANEIRESFATMSTDAEGTIGDYWLGTAATDFLSRWSTVCDHAGLVAAHLESLIDGLKLSSSGSQSAEWTNADSIRTLNLD